MKIKNWDKWQTYRQDRGAPPWIKVHRNLMSNSDWVGMSDAEKGQLVSMWIVAADKAGHLPDDPAMIRKMCILDGTPDINKFKRLGFIDAKRMPRRRQPDAPETETETETDIKSTYGEHGKVNLTDQEHEKINDYTGGRRDHYIDSLDRYLAQSTKRYKSHYAVLQNFYRRDVDSGKVKERPAVADINKYL